ncbi:MAG: bifunctional (p)ppGpp synthetase/guanosine-3',5'-bis(diphosphate) 3'-pyrophosphohydrolase [Myxococcales bacterium]|nr:bifunctional (p)ppGpp synthetase/guanosine-3',5'-bis(diphosphate) 3'-pyrophosphohydrolase [Myxococcales bacterium]MCB9524333.1 bifunctional (p)ppGpp synthetase/guanosine-3',5'-bis(diphosphate) 3'-pyrophosphohydrolase [Myxococcales bacterium]
MVRLDNVIDELRKHHPDADTDLVRRAYVFSAAKHRGQTRRNGEPYLIHPLEVAHIASQLQLDTASVVAGLLHDVVEDTDTDISEIFETFGEDVAKLVQGLTKLEKVRFKSTEEAQAENFRKMLIAMSRDMRVILVKLCDRLHNMRTLEFMPPDKQARIGRETLEIFAPLANRLGINWIKTELEDLSFKYLYPEDYRDLADRIAKTRAEREAYIDRVIAELREQLGVHDIEAKVMGRPKHLWSIHQKLKGRDDRDLSRLYDMLAFRIVVAEQATCYEALGMVHAVWKPIPGRFKDYVALPKENGYQSLHTAVMGPDNERIEIQIRTHEMHHTAEYGVAAHWAYKEGKGGGPTGGKGLDDHRRFAWLRQLLEWQRDLTDPTDFMETVKVDLFDNEVYVFTPEGEVRAFPRGATPVDFAYAIHTTLGHECTGAKVNGRVVPLRYQLQNGDKIEILRTSGSKPKPDWLKFVKTGRAATKIRGYVRRESNARSLQIGQELLEKELRRYGLGLNKLRKTGKIDEACQTLKFKTESELMLALGYGRSRVETVIERLVPEELLDRGPATEPRESAFTRLVRKVIPKGKGGVEVDGLDGVAIHFPQCCAPVHGDDIVGYVSRGRGVAVHRRDCPRARDYDPARRVDVRWDGASKQLRPVQIRVDSTDAPGLLASMSQSFHNAGVNITAVNCRTTEDHRAVNNFTVLVNDLSQLNKVIKAIERIEGVTTVERISS